MRLNICIKNKSEYMANLLVSAIRSQAILTLLYKNAMIKNNMMNMMQSAMPEKTD